ncbi:MAG: protein sorting system archaetidylserine synthase [Halolamina sp.]
MRSRFLCRLGPADAVTVGNAALGFLAVVAAAVDIGLAARLVLLGAIADGLDGVVARRYGGTDAGPYLDSLADVATFGVAPAFLVAVVTRREWGSTAVLLEGVSTDGLLALAGVVVPALYVAAAVTRLGLYTAYDTESDETVGVPTTLAATIFGAIVLTGYRTTETVLVGFHDANFLLVLAAVLTPLMLCDVVYPDLHAQDALVMGVVQAGAVLLPGLYGRGFAFGLLYLALAYLVLGPVLYWRR